MKKVFLITLFLFSSFKVYSLEVTLTQGSVKPTPIAVTELYSKNTQLTKVGKNIATVISDNLERSGLFLPIDKRSFIQDNESLSNKPRFEDWKLIKAQHLVSGKISTSNGKISVEFRLFDVFQQKQIVGKKYETNENITLSISEIDILRQQLSSCWNAPAGAVIERGDKVTISAKVLQNMKVSPNSIRIVDTNIAKTNPFYGPITDSAMRTLLNPECTPLKLPKDKYNLWKNLTITFDYSIMKGY